MHGGKNMKRISVYLVTALALVCLFTGCKSNNNMTTPTVEPTSAPTTEVTVQPTESPLPSDDLLPDKDDGVIDDDNGTVENNGTIVDKAKKDIEEKTARSIKPQ